MAFAVTSRVELAAETAEKLAKTASLTGVGNKPILDFLYATAEQAIEADDFKICVRMLDLGLDIAKWNLQDPVTTRTFQLRRMSAAELAKQFEDAQQDDVAMGKYLCFRKGDWKKGLPLLAKSKDDSLAAVARRDASQPIEAKDQTDLGDAWWDLAAKAEGTARVGMLRRAIHWYRKGVDDLAGLAKLKTDARIKKGTAEVAAAHAKSGLLGPGGKELPPLVRMLTSTRWIHKGMYVYEFSQDGTYVLVDTKRHGKYEISQDSTKITLRWIGETWIDTITPNAMPSMWKINNDPFTPTAQKDKQ